MAAESVWDNSQKTVIRYVLDGDWSWNQFQNVLDVSRQEIRLLPHWVDVIVDMSTSNKLPPDTLANLRTVATHRTSNSGMIVIVGANPHAVSVYQAFQRVYNLLDHRLGLHFAETVEDAHNIILTERVSVGS